MNAWDILIILLIGAAVVMSFRTWKGKQKGGGCSCGCGGCTKDCPTRRRENTNKTNH